MGEDQIELIAERAAKKAVEQFHKECPSFPSEQRKVIHTFAENSTPESAHALATFGKRIHEASTKLTSILLWIIIGSAVWIAGATTFAKFADIFKGTPKP